MLEENSFFDDAPLFTGVQGLKARRSGKNEEEEDALALKVHLTCGVNNDQTCMMRGKLIQDKINKSFLGKNQSQDRN